MSRNFWSLLMLLAFVMTAGAGYFLYERLQEKSAAASVPMKNLEPVTPVATSTTTATPAVQAASGTVAGVEISSMSVLGSSGTVTTTLKPVLLPGGKIATTFTYDVDAKMVYLIGDFSDWMRKPMKKKGTSWVFNIPLKPGRYEYMFVVNGKRIKDPKNSLLSDKGRSLIDVPAPGSN